MSDRTWPALDVRFPRAESAAPDDDGFFAAFLDDYRPTAIADTSTRDAPSWRVFFADGRERAAAESGIHAAWPSLSVASVDVPDEQWAERSQASLRAVRVGRVVVAPPWDVARAQRGEVEGDETAWTGPAILVLIEPSMGFGTGHHESTRLCLRALQQVDLRGRTVIDLGTGSGVLAIAAALLGAGRVLAIDDDADAVQAARENVELNGVAARVNVQQADLTSASPEPTGVVIGNLTGGLLRRYADQVRACLAPGGTLILGGFTQDERVAVAHAFHPLKVAADAHEQGWLALTLR